MLTAANKQFKIDAKNAVFDENKLKIFIQILSNMINSGYPGACAIPPTTAAVINSGESVPPIVL